MPAYVYLCRPLPLLLPLLMTTKPALILTPTEARVLAVLIEKERTVPDTYPLTLNALAAGCNQKTSREPVMNCSDSDILEALDSLRRHSLILETSGGRVMRYAHNTKRVLEIPSESVALVAILLLRGPQTAAELRTNCERLCRFSDVSAVEGFLSELAERASGALVAALPRQPGTREGRWAATLVAGAPVPAGESLARDIRAGLPTSQLPGADEPPAGDPTVVALEFAELQRRVERLEQTVEALNRTLQRLTESAR